jgi:predicted integral membrane protein DUF2269
MLATSYYVPDHFSFYNLVLFVHVAAAVAAFGGTLAYGLIQAFVMRPEGRPHAAFWHRLQGELGKKMIIPAATVVLIAGIYMVAAGNFDFSDAFVSIGIIIIVVLLGLGGAFFAPNEERIAEIAQRDIDTAGAGEVVFSDEYNALARRLAAVGIAANLLVLLAIFLMVIKPS